MLVPAMAFAWCVISAEAAEVKHAVRAQTTQTTQTAQAALAPAAAGLDAATVASASAPVPSVVPSVVEGQRTPIRGVIPAEVIALARTLVNLPMGSEQVEAIEGQRYVFVLERHYHPPGFVGAPNGWHKGVTAYELH